MTMFGQNATNTRSLLTVALSRALGPSPAPDAAREAVAALDGYLQVLEKEITALRQNVDDLKKRQRP